MHRNLAAETLQGNLKRIHISLATFEKRQERATITSKSHLEDLVQLLLAQRLLAGDKVDSEEEHQQAVAYVSKHDGKQEGEGDDGEDRRVDLPVPSYPIRMHNLLEGAVDLVCLKVGGRGLVSDQGLEDSSYLQQY